MSFFCLPIVCGTRQWDKPYDPDPRLNSIYCPNCHNNSVGPVKRREFITLWFIPLFPIYWGKQLRCPICQWRQDFKNREQLQKVVNEQGNIHKGAGPMWHARDLYRSFGIADCGPITSKWKIFSRASIASGGGFGEFFFPFFNVSIGRGEVSVKQRYLYIFGSKSFFRIHISIFYSLLLVK